MRREESLKSSGVTTGPQFEQALSVAEALLTQADQAKATAYRVLTGQIILISIATVTIAIVAGISDASSTRRFLVSFVVAAVGIAAVGVTHVIVKAFFRNQSERDIQAVVDIASLLREVLPLVSDVEDWNETEMRLADARLSRFPIG